MKPIDTAHRDIPADPLCGCLLQTDCSRLAAQLATREVAMIEWRVDCFLADHPGEELRFAWEALAGPGRLPVIFTCRSRGQGGLYAGGETEREELYHRAADAGADWLDLEWEKDSGLTAGLKNRSHPGRILLSWHDFEKTPSSSELRQKLRSMADAGADAAKLVTMARSRDDALRVLDLIPYGREVPGIPVVAFCMGEVARWSRVICCLVGSPWSYVRLRGQPPAAPGQLCAAEAMRALRILGWDEGGGGGPPEK